MAVSKTKTTVQSKKAGLRTSSGPSQEARKKFALPDGSFPVIDAKSAVSAIKLRGHGEKTQVLNHVAAWAKANNNADVLAKVKLARKVDAQSS